YGSDQFTFRVSDGVLSSSLAVVQISVVGVNDAPVAELVSASGPEDVPVSVLLSGRDQEGGTLAYQIVQAPQNGVLSGQGAQRTYTPKANFNGVDSFTYTVFDGVLQSDPATVSLTLEPVNDAPMAQTLSVQGSEDVNLDVTVIASDADGDALTYQLFGLPKLGLIQGTAPDWVYVPNANAHGNDQFSYVVSDGVLQTAPVNVDIFMAPVNDAPTAGDMNLVVDEDGALSFLLDGKDVDGDELSYVLVTQPQHGNLSGTLPSMVYTPNPDFNGSDGFSYSVSDGSLTSAVASVQITVQAVADALTVQSQVVNLDEDTFKAVTLVGSSPDAGSLSYQIARGPSHGVLTGQAPDVVYTPDADYHGSDSFTFKVVQGGASSASALVELSILPVNDPPVAKSGSVQTQEDLAVSLDLGAEDADGDALSYTIVDAPSKGTLSEDGALRVYTPDANFYGSDQFTFRVSDGVLSSS
ncbi:MAG: tandem-95 repeat protein, partial [Limisphaerales bacterium]